MTELKYYVDQYLKQTKAIITKIDDKGIYLDNSVSYAEGGGQPGDFGWINSIPYTNTLHINGDVCHIMKDRSSVKVGDEVDLTIDWEHRYDYMRVHSAQHLLSGLLYSHFNIGTLAIHQGEDILTIETDKSEICEDILYKVEDLANEVICKNVKIYSKEVTHEEAEGLNLRREIKVSGDVRVVFIDGYDVIACGGLHTLTTGEIGFINYSGYEIIRNHVRVIFRVANRAIRKQRELFKSVKEISKLLSVPEGRVSSQVEKLIEENKELKLKIKELEVLGAKGLLVASGNVFSSIYPLSSYQSLLTSGTYFISHTSNKTNFLFYGTKEQFDTLKKELSEYKLKGGGKERLFQGVVELSEGELLEKVKPIIDSFGVFDEGCKA